MWKSESNESPHVIGPVCAPLYPATRNCNTKINAVRCALLPPVDGASVGRGAATRS